MEFADATPQETIKTELGTVGFAREGSGPPVLFVHGSPGGTDSSLAMGRFLVEAGFELIAPARPGYPGTPLGELTAIDAQADLHAALLDALGVESAAVITWSGGGPSGYRLAVRHPEKVRALTGFASVSQSYTPPKEGIDEKLIENTSAGNWLLRFLADHSPKSTVSSTLAAEGDLSLQELKALVEEAMSDQSERDVVLTMARVVADHANRVGGLENDMARFGEIDDLELEKISAPSLIIHGTADVDVTPDHGDHAAAAIPGASFVLMEKGTHLSLFVHPEARATQQKVLDLFAG